MTEATRETGNLMFIFTYILGWISGILVYITEGQRNGRMKFHSLQAIFLGLIATVVDIYSSSYHIWGRCRRSSSGSTECI